MIRLVYSPDWFFGKDLMIDVISLVVLLLISVFAVKCYKINKNKGYLNFSIAFSLMALSFLFKILTNFTIYYTSFVENESLELVTLAYRASNILLIGGFLGYFFFGLLGLLSLFLVYKREIPREAMFLMVYFILLTTFVSMIYFCTFHLTSLIFLTFITATLIKNYKNNKSVTSKLLVYAFTIITASQLMFVFMGVHPLIYVIAETVQLIGYLVLFGVFFKIIKNGKKE